MVHGDIPRRWSFTLLFFLAAVFVFVTPRARADMTCVSASTAEREKSIRRAPPPMKPSKAPGMGWRWFHSEYRA